MFVAGLLLKGVKSRYSTGSIVGTLFECCIRFLQFVFGIAVIGLYAQDVDRARKHGDSQDSRWVRSLYFLREIRYHILTVL